jgi:hypothetical protein
MIPAVRLGATVFRLGLEQLVRSPAIMPLVPGSQNLELNIHAALNLPERWALPPVWDEVWWDWGHTLWTMGVALQKREHLLRVARNLTLEQQAALWQDPSEQAAALRRVMRLDAERARAAG